MMDFFGQVMLKFLEICLSEIAINELIVWEI